MKKNILILYPKNFKEGQPAKQRIDSFKQFYENNNCTVYIKQTPITIKEKVRLVQFLYEKEIRNIFISMPSFRNWFIFFIPFVSVILDIRDGWSIAMKSGYGGTSKPSNQKAYIASLFERFGIARATITVTCTNGLQSYLENLVSKKVLLITNGYSKNDFEIVQKLKHEINGEQEKSFDTAVCAGQFAEYGKDKIKILLKKINKNSKRTVIKLIGSNIEKNKWVVDWIEAEGLANIELQILPRMNRIEMYKEILKADYGIAVIRDPFYDFGTKVFDYILCSKPIFDYFGEGNNFTVFFENQLTSSKKQDFNIEFLREKLIEREKKLLLGSLR